jgi:hypothetical protein
MASRAWKIPVAALAVMGLTLVPYVIGWSVQTKDAIFGGFIFDLADANSYLAVMRLGMRVEWRFVSLYTPEPQSGVWIHTLYVALGHVVRLTGLPILVVYHGARVACGFLLLLSVYKFVGFFLRRRAQRWTAFLLVALSSGVGWFTELVWPTAPGGISPLDFWFLDAYTFLGILTFPHFALAWAALLGAFWFALSYVEAPRVGCLLLGAASAFVATAVHPTLVLVLSGVLAVYGVASWAVERRFPVRWIVSGLPVALGAGAMVVYLMLAFRADPLLASYGQGIMQSPPPWYYVVGYGLLGPLALVGSIDVIGRRDRRGGFLVVWVAVAFALAYCPLVMQRRLIEGVHIPICTLAAVGLHCRVLAAVARSRPVRAVARLGYPRRRAVWLARSLLIVMTWFSNLYLVGSTGMAVAAHEPSLFLSASQWAAFDWLRDSLTEDDVVLASYGTGNLIPAWTGHRVFLGHWSESLDWPGREEQVKTFFDADTADAWRVALLRQHTITHVFYGSRERALGSFDPTAVSWLEPAFRSGEVAVYRVVSEEKP